MFIWGKQKFYKNKYKDMTYFKILSTTSSNLNFKFNCFKQSCMKLAERKYSSNQSS